MMKAFSQIIFKCAVLCFPRRITDLHGREMVEAFRTALDKRLREKGGSAAVWYATSAIGAAIRQGIRERLRCRRLRNHHAGGKGPTRRTGICHGLGMDLRLVFRSMKNAPGFAAAAVVVLALGIGANTTLFSALKAAILTPPPFPDAERLVVADLVSERDGHEVGIAPWWPYPSFEMLRRTEGRLTDPVAAYRSDRATLSGGGIPTEIGIEIVSHEYFTVLGVTPMKGRLFHPDEGDFERPSHATVISHRFWLSHFGGDDFVVGREVMLNGRPFEVIGVAPRWFRGLKGDATLWVPVGGVGAFMNVQSLRRPHDHAWYVVGRLRPRAQLDAARAQMQTIGAAIDAAFPFNVSGHHYVGDLKSFREAWTNDGARKSVLMLSGAALLVLLVACANLSGLLLARHVRQTHENAVRLAVGASRWRLVRSSLTQSVVLACLAGFAGVGLAHWGTRVLRNQWPERFLDNVKEELRVVNIDSLSVDGSVLACAVAITLATAVLVGVLPALRFTRPDLATGLKAGAGGTRRRARSLGFDVGEGMIAVQTAMAFMLLIGAGLVGESVRRLFDVELGFRAHHLLTFEYELPRSEHPADRATMLERSRDFTDEFLRRIRTLPGVQGATNGCIPLRGVCNAYSVTGTERTPEIPRGERPRVGVSAAGASYFDVLGIPILAGRTIDDRDERDNRITVVLSETAVDMLFPGENPIGRWIELNGNRAEVVGVAGVVLREPPDQVQLPEAIVSFRDLPTGGGVMIRTAGDPLALLPLVRNELRVLDPRVPLTDVATMDEMVIRSVGDRRLILSLLSAFAAVTVLLVAVGMWAIVARAVTDRTRDIGVRIALGARAKRVVPLVLGRSMIAAFLGLGVGVACAFASTRVLQAFLFQTEARDLSTFVWGTILLFGTVLIASYLPARRALGIDPIEVLRAE